MKLQQHFPLDSLDQLLIPRAAWQPYPPIANRSFWNELPDRDQLIERAAATIGIPWPELLATHFLDFSRNGNRTRQQDRQFPRRTRLAELVLAECAEHQGRFVDEILNGIWLICEESYWGVSAHVGGLPNVDAPFVDLFAAETAMLLSIVDYLMADQLDAASPLFRQRIRLETQKRILTPVLEHRIAWMGLEGHPVNNWNPWIISNWLVTALLLVDDPATRTAHVRKAVCCLDNFLQHYPADGGCDEGPGYWGRAAASLFDCLHILHSATGGALNAYDQPLIGEMGRYICRMHIDGTWFVNFADASALIKPGGESIYRYGQAIGDDTMRRFGAYWVQQSTGASFGSSLARTLPDLATRGEALAAPATTPHLRDAWLPGIAVMVARDAEGSADGLYIAAKGGHNAESHNHNDIGSFIVFSNGLPLLVDAGVEAYSRKTFSNERYTIWTMQSAWHNLPTINGLMQVNGRQACATHVDYTVDDDQATLALNIDAWPAEAAVVRWRRTMHLQRRQHVRIDDTWELTEVREPLEFHLLTPSEVRIDGDRIHLTSRQLPGGRQTAPGTILLGDTAWQPSAEVKPISDSNLSRTWGEHLTRLTLTIDSPPLRGQASLLILPA